MNEKKYIQFLMAANKGAIQALEDEISYYRHVKTVADAKEDLAEEYTAHNALKYLRKELKKHVGSHKLLKKLMKD